MLGAFAPVSQKYFYPRSPCGERPLTACKYACKPEFLSTLSLRRATKRPKRIPVKSIFLSTLSLRRATLESLIFRPQHLDFYPRSPCGERLAMIGQTGRLWQFLSTLSLRRATPAKIYRISSEIFLSTLSLRRATLAAITLREVLAYFYPRSPCGERLFNTLQIIVDGYFYPRSPCGERQTHSALPLPA